MSQNRSDCLTTFFIALKEPKRDSSTGQTVIDDTRRFGSSKPCPG